MRLGTRTRDVVRETVHYALAAERTVIIPVADRRRAQRMFRAVTGFIEELGGNPDNSRCAWRFHNGSVIKFGS